MERVSLAKELSSTTYPGRGIVIGRTKDGKKAVTAYFIMGRSENSRNRVFVEDGEGIRTQAFDPSKLEDPSLIIYAPVRVLGNKTIVTNGDQTDTIYELMDKQQTFEQALRTREFEPDAPNYTPRISGIMHIDNGEFNYAMSILKSNNGNPDACNRYTFAYSAPVAGEGHFIHTYMGDGNPLPSFEGEPTWVDIDGDIDEFTNMVWENLNKDNKVSLFVRYIDIAIICAETYLQIRLFITQAVDSFRLINQPVKEQLHSIEHLIIGNTTHNQVVIGRIFPAAAVQNKIQPFFGIRIEFQHFQFRFPAFIVFIPGNNTVFPTTFELAAPLCSLFI